MQSLKKNDVLSLSLVQFDIYWEDIEKNIIFLEKLLPASLKTDILIFPEMFSTGFTMHADAWKEKNITALQWMKKTAIRYKAMVCGSLIFSCSSRAVNRFFAIFPDGKKIITYDKRHLFRMAEENQFYQQGQQKITFTFKGWKISPYICYDLRFPVWSRNISLRSQPLYDLAIYVANWPEARIVAWDTLLKARAIENSCYVAGVNRTGIDGNNIQYSGHSAVYDFKGDTLSFSRQSNEIIHCKISKSTLFHYRRKFPAHLDADRFFLE